MAESRDAPSDDERILIERFQQRKIAKTVYSSKLPYFISKELRSELDILQHILNNPDSYPWVGHIAHIVPRDHDFVSYGDSSLHAAGGYSLDLKFWWYIEWPPEIQSKTLKYFKFTIKDHSSGELISINLLEYATAIINYAAATVALQSDPKLFSKNNPYPVLLNFADNESTNSWIRKTPYTTPKHRALSRILCDLRMNNPIGLNSSYISTFDNFIADYISRLHHVDFGSLSDPFIILQKYPALASCQRFQLSQELYSSLIKGLLQEQLPGLHLVKMLGQMIVD